MTWTAETVGGSAGPTTFEIEAPNKPTIPATPMDNPQAFSYRQIAIYKATAIEQTIVSLNSLGAEYDSAILNLVAAMNSGGTPA